MSNALLSQIEEFCRASGMSVTRFGDQSIGDRGLIRRLRAGGSVTLPTADRIYKFIREHEPSRVAS